MYSAVECTRGTVVQVAQPHCIVVDTVAAGIVVDSDVGTFVGVDQDDDKVKFGADISVVTAVVANETHSQSKRLGGDLRRAPPFPSCRRCCRISLTN